MARARRRPDRLFVATWQIGVTHSVADGAASYSIPMPTFKLQFPPSEIEALASRFGYADDARYLAVGAAARARGHYSRDEFIEVCGWKTARSRSRIASNDEAAVIEATRRALAGDNEGMRMVALLDLAGVGVPTASTLLYFAFPDDYPILDVRALESLGVKPRSQYPVTFWLEYLSACRELARRCAVSMRTLDKALWQHSKERAAWSGPTKSITNPPPLRAGESTGHTMRARDSPAALSRRPGRSRGTRT